MSITVRIRLIVLSAIAAAGLPLLSVLPAMPAHADISFTSEGTRPTGQPWLGFGTNEYPQDRDSSGADTPWAAAIAGHRRER